MAKEITKLGAGQYRVDFDEHCAVEIGASSVGTLVTRAPGFTPDVTLKKWGDECWIKLKSQASYSIKDATEIGIGKIDRLEILSDDDKESTRVYPLDKRKGREDGAFEIEAVLAEKPASGVFEYTWDFAASGNLSITKQWFLDPKTGRPLQSEIDRFGLVSWSDTRGFDKDGIPVCRIREDMINGWVVYRNNTPKMLSGDARKYKTGKVGNIERAWMEDAHGWRVWANSDIDLDTGTYRVFCEDKEFNYNAVLPVRIGPTLGFTSIGSFSGGGDNINAALVSASEDGTITSIFVALSDVTSGDGYQTAIYSDIDDTDDTGPLELTGAEKTASIGSTPTWVEWSGLSGTLTNGEDYAICLHFEDTGEIYYDWLGGTPSRYVYNGYVTNTWDDPLTITTGFGFVFSTYLEYTAGGAVAAAGAGGRTLMGVG